MRFGAYLLIYAPGQTVRYPATDDKPATLPGRLVCDWNSDLFDHDPPLIVDGEFVVEYWAGNSAGGGRPVHRYHPSSTSSRRVPSASAT